MNHGTDFKTSKTQSSYCKHLARKNASLELFQSAISSSTLSSSSELCHLCILHLPRHVCGIEGKEVGCESQDGEANAEDGEDLRLPV
jgi:hypothetical protein